MVSTHGKDRGMIFHDAHSHLNNSSNNKQQQKMKQNEPIPIPHDGNIFWMMLIQQQQHRHPQQQQQQQQNNNGQPTIARDLSLSSDNDVSKLDTMQILETNHVVNNNHVNQMDHLHQLFQCFTRNNKDDNNPNHDISIIEQVKTIEDCCFEYQLLYHMMNSKTMKEQLQSIQNYRNKIDHIERINKKQQQPQQQQQQPQTAVDIDFYKSSEINISHHYQRIFVFTMLLELYFSFHTSTIIKRSLRSSYFSYNIVKELNLLHRTGSHDRLELTHHGQNNQLYATIAFDVLHSIIKIERSHDVEECTKLVSHINLENDGAPCHVKVPKNNWYDTLYSLQEVLDCDFMVQLYSSSVYHVDVLHHSLQLLYHYTTYISTMNHGKFFSSHDTDKNYHHPSFITLIHQSIQIATILNKLLLIAIEWNDSNNNNDANNDDTTTTSTSVHDDDISFLISQLQQFIWKLLVHCPYIPIDNTSILGITYGRILQYQQKLTKSTINETVHDVLHQCYQCHLSDLYKSTIIQGLLSTLSHDSIVQAFLVTQHDDNNSEDSPIHDANSSKTSKRTSAIYRLYEECKRLALSSTCPDVRLHAIKSLRALISKIQTSYEECQRITTILEDDVSQENITTNSLLSNNIYDILLDIMQIVFIVWDNPPTKKLASSIPGLFDALIRLLMKLDMSHSITTIANNKNTVLNELLQHILNKPLNRKCRYLALETLLPITGANVILYSGNAIITTTNTIPKTASIIDDFVHGVGDRGGYNAGVIADLWAKLLHRSLVETKQGVSIQHDTAIGKDSHDGTNNSCDDCDHHHLPISWLDIWIPTLARALSEQEPVRRKQVASFCLPRFDTIVQSNRDDLAECYHTLLKHIRRQQVDNKPPSLDRETSRDRIFWAEMEVIRYAGLAGLLKPLPIPDQVDSTIIKFQKFVKEIMPLDRLRYGISHVVPIVSIVSFQIINYVVVNDSYHDGQVSEGITMKTIEIEVNIWKDALPYVTKVEGKEFVSSILYCLLSLLDRVSATEGVMLTNLKATADGKERLPTLYSFIVDFLLYNLMVTKLGYPGTVALKEHFFVSLLECILVFVDRNHSLAWESKLLPKTCPVFHRKRLQIEDDTIGDIRTAMISREIFASLFVLLRSPWDNTRVESFRMLLCLCQMSQTYNIPLPEEYSSDIARTNYESLGIYLASSPRQREADTGSRILAFLCVSVHELSEKLAFLDRMIKILEERITSMKMILESLFLESFDVEAEQEFPLCHGIVHCIKLVLQNDKVFCRDNFDQNSSLCAHISKCLYDSICVSLSIVADLKDGEVLEGTDEQLAFACLARRNDIINPGAIGANGLFSSVTRLTESEKAKRLVSQRIVVGSWLLTKYACSTWAAFLAMPFVKEMESAYKDAGELLISTLASLKHAGAAYAAHESLQQITMSCLGSQDIESIRALPRHWALRLLREVSETDKVKDSTLRRSTGYALGFLSILRSLTKVPSISERLLCQHCIVSLLRLSLPPKNHFEKLIMLLQFNGTDSQLLLSYNSESNPISLVADEDYSEKSRIHSLNILRLLLLDAPLARELLPFVGVAFVSASLGYTDDAWNIRNSSTMVFAAAMLRSVDPDKNASNADETVSRAVAMSEFFRLYPHLPRFFLAILREGGSGTLDSNSSQSYPYILPVLLLFARVHHSPGLDEFKEDGDLITALMRCLNHPDIRVREATARSLRNVTVGETKSNSSALHVLALCENTLLYCNRSVVLGRAVQWNEYHGTLLVIRELLSESNMLFERNNPLHIEILRITDLSCLGRVVPPLCLSVALQILERVQQPDLADRCDIITNWSNNIAMGSHSKSIFADLLSVSASIRMKLACNTIWSKVSSTKEVNDSFKRIEQIISSDSYDVKIKSLKLFKKSLHDGLHSLSNDATSHQKLDTLCNMLSVALCNDYDVHSRVVVPIYQPSFRRMLRCLLECVYAKVRIFQSYDTIIIKRKVINHSLTFMKHKEIIAEKGNHSLLSLLYGNILELIPFALNGTDDILSHDLWRLFGLLVSRLSHPSVHWRLRHSAAVALSNSKFGTQGIFCCWEMLWGWFDLMHDSDPDVRIEAAAISKTGTLYEQCCNTELSIANGFNILCCFSSKTVLGQVLIRRLDVLTCDILEKVSRLDNILPLKKHANAMKHWNKERMIFEEEEPNSYKEICIVGQLTSREILRYHASCQGNAFEDIETCQVITNRCHKVLPIILDNLNATSRLFAENCSRNPCLFPDLHNLLLGTCCAILLARNSLSVLASISNFPSALEQLAKHERSIHPSIVSAIQSVSFASTGDDKQAINAALRSCFLFQ